MGWDANVSYTFRESTWCGRSHQERALRCSLQPGIRCSPGQQNAAELPHGVLLSVWNCCSENFQLLTTNWKRNSIRNKTPLFFHTLGSLIWQSDGRVNLSSFFFPERLKIKKKIPGKINPVLNTRSTPFDRLGEKKPHINHNHLKGLSCSREAAIRYKAKLSFETKLLH